MDSTCMVMAALGRPLYPGMLYDCRRDSFIPGVTLWDKKALNDDLDVHYQPKTHLKFAASDSLSDKANLLDVSASLKASFLSGLIEVGGSAKYLNDTKSSARQCRVTMQYSQTTSFKQMTMTDLVNITYPQVFEQKTATHVITAVLYGGQAFMVFDYTAADNESKQAVEGNLHAVIKKIPTISIEGEASLKMNEEEKKMSENISVTFYGDYELEQNPTTYKEALEVFKTLPTLMNGENHDGVPLTVWLYPLTLLDDKAAKLVREIHTSLVNKTENVLEELGEVERRCNDLIKSQMTEDFPDLKHRLLQFVDSHSSYKIAFQKELSRVLPAIRSGKLENKVLGDILNTHYMSPFTANKMNQWLDDMMTELNVLNSYTSVLKDITVARSLGSLNCILFDPNVDVVVCLSFNSVRGNKDDYLVATQDFLNSELFTEMEQKHGEVSFSLAAQPWFTSPDISERMRQNLSLFTSFSKANKNDKRMKFIIASISDSSNPGNSIRLYQKGLQKVSDFQPVSKPPKPELETSDRKVILKLLKSPTGKTVQFRVEYRTTPPTDSKDDNDKWTVTDTSDAQSSFTLTGLTVAEQYWVRYRAVSDVGVSEASDPVPFSFHSNLQVTMNQWDFLSSLFKKPKRKIITSMGISRWSASTIKSEITNIDDSPSIPYNNTIPGGLREGMALYLQGVALATRAANSFDFNLLTGPEVNDDIAFHTHFHLGKSVVRNSLRNGSWENEEQTSGCPIPEGSAFDIFVVTKRERYEVYFNGQQFCLFNHRMPFDRVTTLRIHGDVIINITGIVENWNSSIFAKELNSGVAPTRFSDIQSDMPHPVCSPRKRYLGRISRSLRPGLALFFQGVVPSDCERFEINLQTGPRYMSSIALHFNPRLHTVVLNSCRDGGWGDEERIQGGPFVKGGAFDIIMVIKPEAYEVIVNGLEFCTFEHRIPVDKVTTLDIRGDVFMNAFSIIEVNDVSLKVTAPANF